MPYSSSVSKSWAGRTTSLTAGLSDFLGNFDHGQVVCRSRGQWICGLFGGFYRLGSRTYREAYHILLHFVPCQKDPQVPLILGTSLDMDGYGDKHFLTPICKSPRRDFQFLGKVWLMVGSFLSTSIVSVAMIPSEIQTNMLFSKHLGGFRSKSASLRSHQIKHPHQPETFDGRSSWFSSFQLQRLAVGFSQRSQVSVSTWSFVSVTALLWPRGWNTSPWSVSAGGKLVTNVRMGGWGWNHVFTDSDVIIPQQQQQQQQQQQRQRQSPTNQKCLLQARGEELMTCLTLLDPLFHQSKISVQGTHTQQQKSTMNPSFSSEDIFGFGRRRPIEVFIWKVHRETTKRPATFHLVWTRNV